MIKLLERRNFYIEMDFLSSIDDSGISLKFLWSFETYRIVLYTTRPCSELNLSALLRVNRDCSIFFSPQILGNMFHHKKFTIHIASGSKGWLTMETDFSTCIIENHEIHNIKHMIKQSLFGYRKSAVFISGK